MHKLLTGSGEYLSGDELRQRGLRKNIQNTTKFSLFNTKTMQASMTGLMVVPLIELGGRSDLAVKTGREKKRCWR